MKINVRMLAHHDALTVRPVELPYEANQVTSTDVNDLLNDVYVWGQNENCTDRQITSTTCSVSIGDVVELPDGTNYLVSGGGSFTRLDPVAYDTYKAIPDRLDRKQFAESHGG